MEQIRGYVRFFISSQYWPYVKISDWHKKGMLKAKIRSSFKMLLPKYIKPEALSEYEILDRISGEIVEHAEILFAMAA